MSQFEKEIKAYAEGGPRTAADWTALGRQVIDGTLLRTSTPSHRQVHDLVSRDQTKPAESSPRG